MFSLAACAAFRANPSGSTLWILLRLPPEAQQRACRQQMEKKMVCLSAPASNSLYHSLARVLYLLFLFHYLICLVSPFDRCILENDGILYYWKTAAASTDPTAGAWARLSFCGRMCLQGGVASSARGVCVAYQLQYFFPFDVQRRAPSHLLDTV